MKDTLPPCDPERPVLLGGATASGKSALALDLALREGRAVVNADALQVFGGWRILTARPDAAACAAAPHLLYGHVDHRAPYSVGDWLRDLRPLLDARPAPVIVGGTGLYFAALLSGLADIPPTDPDIRRLAGARLLADGADALIAELDPATRARIDLRNPVRVQRAWEVQTQTGRGLAYWQARTGPPLLAPDTACRFVLQCDRDRLATRIDRRFDRMLADGAWAEIAAMAADWDPARQSSRAIGAAELMAAHAGVLPVGAAVAAAKTATRQYAKRQRTWMRSKMADWQPLFIPC